jgi:hypothetical protein
MRGIGGSEEPCVNRITLLKIQRESKRVCPRFELDADNEVLAAIAWFAVKLGGDHPLFSKFFDLQTAGLDNEARLAVFGRILSAVSDEGIAARIKAARERALRQKD